MAKYRFTRKAVEDLSDIWHYTLETWSQKQAARYYRMLIECCRNIAEHPLAGRHYAEVAEGVYGLRAGKHIVFYRIAAPNEIEVIRILHGSMDLKTRVGE